MVKKRLVYLALMLFKSKRVFAATLVAVCSFPPSAYIPCDYSGCVQVAMSGGSEELSLSYGINSANHARSSASIQAFNSDSQFLYNKLAADITAFTATQQIAIEIHKLTLVEAINASTVAESAGLAQTIAITKGLQRSYLNSLGVAFGNFIKLAQSQQEFLDQTLPAQMYQMISVTEDIFDLRDYFAQIHELESKLLALESMKENGEQIYAMSLEQTTTELKEDIMRINTSFDAFIPNFNANGEPTNPKSEGLLVLLKQEKNNLLENYIYRQKMNEFIDNI